MFDFAPTVCREWGRRRYWGDESGSEQTHRGAGHLCLYLGREIHFLSLWVPHQSHWQFFPDVRACSQGCRSGIRGADGETENRTHICPSRRFFIFSGRATFSSLWQRKRKCSPRLNWISSVSTRHSEKVYVFCEWRVPGSFLPVGNARRSFFFPARLWWLEEVKRHLAADGLYLGRASLRFLCPISSLIFFFSKCTFETCSHIITYHLEWHFIWLICGVMAPRFSKTKTRVAVMVVVFLQGELCSSGEEIQTIWAQICIFFFSITE